MAFPAFSDGTYGGTSSSLSELNINGTLIAEGTAENPIIFTSDAEGSLYSGEWAGITVNGSLWLKNAVVEYGTFGIRFIGEQNSDQIHIADSTIQNNFGNGIDISAGYNAAVVAVVENTSILNNQGFGITSRAHSGATSLSATFCNNSITNNGTEGIYLFADGSSGDPIINGTICNNTIADHSTYGIHLYTYQGARSNLTVENNIISRSGIGIYGYFYNGSASSTLLLASNTLQDQSEGIKIYANNSTLTPQFQNNIIHGQSANGITCTYAGNYSFVPYFAGNQVFENAGDGIHLQATDIITLLNNGLYGNYLSDLYNDSPHDVDASQNWWGINTTNQINTGGNPKNLSAIFDSYDDSTKGTVIYDNWLNLYEIPNKPTLNSISTPTASSTQILSGTKNSASSIILNGAVIVPVDNALIWSYEMTLNEGSNPISIYSRNAAGMASNVVVSSIILDTTPPVVYSSVPADGSSVNHALTYIDVTLLEESTGIDTTATLSGASVTSDGSEVPGQWHIDYNHVIFTPDTPLTAGSYTLTFHPTDSPLGNTITATITFNVDLTAPASPTLNEIHSPTNVTPQLLSGTKDPGTSVWLNNLQIVPLNELSEWTHNVGLAEGENTFKLHAKDIAANRSDDVSFAIVLDRTPPVLQSTQPANGAYVNAPPATVVFNFTDTTTSLAADPTLATAAVNDIHGQEIPGTWQLQAPGTIIFTPSAPFAEESYTATVEAIDQAGNKSGSKVITFTIDSTAPSTFTLNPVTSPTNFVIQTLTGTKEVNTSVWINGVEVVPLNSETVWSHQVTLVEGNNSFTIYSQDASANRSETLQAEITYDETAPLPVLTLAADGNGIGTTARLTWTGYNEAIQGDIASYRIYMQEQLFTQLAGLDYIAELPAGTFEYTVTNLTKGTRYYFAVVAVDTYGNAHTSVTPVSAVPVDTVAPEEVSNFHVTCFDTRLDFSWSPSIDSHGDLAGYKVYFNSSPETVVLPASVNSFEATNLSSAVSYPFRITTYDQDGNESAGISTSGITLLENPANVSAEIGNGYVDVSWSGVEPSQLVKNYSIYISTDNFSTVEGMTPVQNVTGTTGRVTGLTNNTTYFIAVTTVNLSGGEALPVVAVSATPVPDGTGPVLSQVNLNGAPLVNGIVLHTTGLFTLQATDPSGVSRVEFHIDGSPYFTDSKGPLNYACSWLVAAEEDGEHQLDIIAYDTLGNSTTISYTVTVALELPPAPVISSPVSGTITNKTSINIVGSSVQLAEILLYNNGQAVSGATPVDANGSFSIAVTLSEGENRIRAAAQNRAGIGPMSPEILITLDSSIPDAPSSLTAQAKENGVIRLSWQQPFAGAVKGYIVYRSTTSFASASGATRLNSSPITGTSYDNLPSEDGLYYYRVAAVNLAGTEGSLSNLASATSDRTPPKAVSIAYATHGASDPVTGAMAQGMVDVVLHVSEPLLLTPFLNITPNGGMPIGVELHKISDFEYTGFFVISESAPSGLAYAVFSGRDLAGNRGTEVETGVTILIDTSGPAVADMVLVPGDPIQNDTNNPVSVTVTFSLNEKVQGGALPELTYLLSGAGRSPETVNSIVEASPVGGFAQTWQGTFVLPSDAGLAEVETLSFIYQGIDDLNNTSTRILCKNLFQVYQGDLPPLATPVNFKGESLPGGKIHLSWTEVPGAIGYRLYRKSPDAEELSPYQQLGQIAEYLDEPSSDGIYTYAITSIREENGQTSESGMSAALQVESDSTAPEPPINLVLSLTGNGIKATWTASSSTELVSYTLYRSGLAAITSVEDATTIVAGVKETETVDPSPSLTEHTYAVTAVDKVGNESIPSGSAYLNFELLPVSSLSVLQNGNDLPVISWSHNGSTIAGYDFYLGPEGRRIKLNDALLTTTSLTDSGYAGDERHYMVIAVDGNGQRSVGRAITLPKISASLAATAKIKRGLMNRLEYQLVNDSQVLVQHARLLVEVDGRVHQSEEFSVAAGASTLIPVIVGGYDDLPDNAEITTSIEIIPNAGEKATIIRTGNIEVIDGVPSLELHPEEFVRGGMGKVRFTLKNVGEAEMEVVTATAFGAAESDEIAMYLLDSDGNILSTQAIKQNLGDGVITLASGMSVARIPAGGSFTSAPVELAVPSTAPENVQILLEISNVHYHLGSADQVSMQGLSTTRDISLVDTSYYGEVLSATPEHSKGDEEIVISGRAVARNTLAPLPLVPLNLVLTSDGFERKYDVYTDSSGNFQYDFHPLAGEAGVYTVSALHPDLNERPVQAQFVIDRLSIKPKTLTVSIPRDYEQQLGITVTAGSGTTINNLRLIYDAINQPGGILPEGILVTLGSAIEVLDPQQAASLSCTVKADDTAAETERIILKVVSDGSSGIEEWGTVIVDLHFSDASPALYVSPNHIETGVAQGQSVTEHLILENRGLAPLEAVSLSLVAEDGSPAPNWVMLNSPANIGNLPVGQQSDVSISFSPSSVTAVPEGMYTFYLKVASSNYQTRDIGLFVAVTQSGKGGVLFKVADIYTGTVDQATGEIVQGMTGAKIEIQNEAVLTVQATQSTDNAGEVLFDDLPAGVYKCKVTANNHQQYIGRFWIKPGITTTKEVFLAYDLVTVEWEVVETTIQDKYEIVLKATYETDVPAAVVIAEPSSITLPEMKKGDVYYGEFTLTNYGLIRADDMQYLLPADDQYYRYELVKGLPDSLDAKERITVPYKVTCISSPSEIVDGSGGGCERYATCVRISYLYVCSNGTSFSGSTVYCFLRDNGECGGSSGNVDGVGDGFVIVGPGSGDWWDYISPRSDELGGGVICWPVSIRREIIFDKNITPWLDTFQDIIHTAGCTVNAVLREYNDEATDLSIKAPGGSIDVRRLFYGNQWHWEQLQANLQLNYDALGQYVESVDKGGAIYEKVSTNPPVFTQDTFRIEAIDSGYRWQDKSGNWKEYDQAGRMVSYGSRIGTTGKLLYEEGENGTLVGISDRNERQVVWIEYNGEGKISAIADNDNRRLEYTYTNSLLTRVVDVLGNETHYEYDGDGRIIRTVDSGGRPTLVSYDAYGNAAEIVDRDGKGHFFQYDYDEATKEHYARLTTTSGKIEEMWYDRDGETKRVDINGRTIKKITKDGRALIVADEKGNITRKDLDEWDNLTRIVFPDGNTASFAYEHTFNHLTRAVDARGNVSTYQYDENGNLTELVKAVGTDDEQATVYTYDDQGQLLTATTEADANTESATSTLTYHENGNLESIVDAEGNRTDFLEYDNMGNLLSMRDPRGNIWTFAYDTMGRQLSKTDPLNHTTTYEYDGANNLTAVINAALKRFELEYNDHNNVVKSIDPTNAFSVTDYNTDQLPTRRVDQEGKESKAEYDNEGRLKKSIDGAGNEIAYFYDESQETFVSSFLPVRIDYPTYSHLIYYDKRQRVIRESDVLDQDNIHSTSYSYDAAGNLLSQTDAEGNITRFEYDTLNRLVKTIDSLGGVTERRYDDRNNLIEIKDPNNGITRNEYDRNNRLVKIVRPLGQETVYEYDAAGNRTAVLDAKGQKIQYGYDEANRLAGINYFAVGDHSTPIKSVAFSYDDLGNMEAYDDGTTSATYTYDDLQRKTGESINYGSFSLGYSYTYYANGLKKSFTGPDGAPYTYSYDENNRLARITFPGQGQLTYNSYLWNSPLKRTMPGGVTREYGYDPLMQVASIAGKDPLQNILMAHDYKYSPRGNVTENDTQSGTYSYKYDELSRLTHATSPVSASESYTYDALGNRLTASGVSGTWEYNENNELNSYGDVTFAYDQNGNTIRKTVGTNISNYIYDINDRLIEVRDGADTVIAQYYYDPFGRRLWKDVGGVRTNFLYANEGLVGEYNASGVEMKSFGYIPNSTWTTNPLYQKIGNRYYWYQNDRLGTPKQMVDSAGCIVWSAIYDSFGRVSAAQEDTDNNLRLPGQYYDEETGLHYNYHRYYDPETGRYLRIDPYEEGINLYSYVFGNPVSLIDPNGLCVAKAVATKPLIWTDDLLLGGKIRDWHYSRNDINDQYWIDRGLYGRSDIRGDELGGLIMISDSEDQFHEQGPGNENNVKFTTTTTGPEWWNRYGKYELILQPNNLDDSNTTYRYVDDSINMGTLNRGQDPVTHTVLDVYLYLAYENRPE